MTELDKGIQVKQPDGSSVFMRGWCILLSADFPAAALCCGFKRSTAAACFCRECYCNQNHDDYPSPTSFLEDNAELMCDLCLRDREQMEADFAHWQSLTTESERSAFLTSIGFNTFEHAFVRVPFFDVTCYVPFDFMHGELEGTLKNELAAMLYYFLRRRPSWNFTLDKLNARIREYVWPGGFAPPTFTSGYLEKGTKSKQVKKGAHVHMTSGDMLVFARHSIELMLPLIGDTADPLWQCWIVHIKYLILLLKHRLTYADIVELDKLIYKHHELFLAATNEYGPHIALSLIACRMNARVCA